MLHCETIHIPTNLKVKTEETNREEICLTFSTFIQGYSL